MPLQDDDADADGKQDMKRRRRAAGKRHDDMSCFFCGDARGPEDELACSQCIAFVETKGLTSQMLKSSLDRDGKKKKEITDEMNEFRSTAEPTWPRETVDFEVEHETKLSDKYKFIPRSTFKELHGCWPEDARMTCVRATNTRGVEVAGILVSNDDDTQPIVEVSTSRRFIKRTPLLLPSSHKYEQQATQLFARETQDAGRNFGLKDGGKYRAKKRSQQAYSLVEIQYNVEAHQNQQARTADQLGTLDRMQIDDHMVASDSDGDSSVDLVEVEGGDDRGDDPDAGGEGIAVQDSTAASEWGEVVSYVWR